MTNLKNEEFVKSTDAYMDEEEQKGVKELQKEFIESYVSSRHIYTDEEWLAIELGKHLPKLPKEEVANISKDIVTSLRTTEEMKVSLDQAIEMGRDKNSWLASKLTEATKQMSVEESARYLQGLDDAIKQANEEMFATITTKAGLPNQNMNLDGFIAEQSHANSFNLSAQAKGSDLHAEVLKPKPGQTYQKNSVDLVVKDANGKIIERYQAKYGATAEDTIKMIKEGDYRGQRLLVPEDQVDKVQKAFPNRKVSSTIGDGNVKSKPLTKEEAKKLQEQAQKGNFMEADWNEYKLGDIAKGVAKQTGLAAVQGAAISTGVMVASKWIQGDKIDGEEVVVEALKTGADVGVKTATAGALKVAVEKGVVKGIPKGVPGATYANIAFVAVENVKVLGKVATGELTLKEGCMQMERTTGACVGGIIASTEGAATGATIGAALGPVGMAVGGFVGGCLGYMAGSKVGEVVVKAAQKVRSVAIDAVKGVYNAAKSVVSTVAETVSSVASSICDFAFGWL